QEKALELATKEIAACDRLSAHIVPIFAPDFPEELKILPDCPLVLYVQGTLVRHNKETVAIIGTRTATDYGKQTTAHFSFRLSQAGITIVSGLARGIDTEAHKAALQKGHT